MTGSLIYKELTTDELNTVIKNLFGNDASILKCSVLKGGMFNTTYYIETSNYQKPLVLRAGPINKHLLFDFEKDMMSAEPMLHDLMKEHGVPTTEVIAYSSESRIIEREFIITEYLDSIVMNDPSLAGVNLDSVYEEVGRLTRKMHDIKAAGFGWIRETKWGEFDSWAAFINRFAAEIYERSLEFGVFAKDTAEGFKYVIEGNQSAFSNITEPRMAHTDIWQGNILLKNENNDLKVAALIDPDRTIFGDIAFDLGTPWITNEFFYKGYGEAKDDGSLELRKKIYGLMIQFFAAYVWKVEYDDSDQYESYKVKSIRQLEELIK